jgi:hypothetical protein
MLKGFVKRVSTEVTNVQVHTVVRIDVASNLCSIASQSESERPSA